MKNLQEGEAVMIHGSDKVSLDRGVFNVVLVACDLTTCRSLCYPNSATTVKSGLATVC